MSKAYEKKLRCWHIVEQALLAGDIIRPDKCECCGKKAAGRGGAALQAHHDDYDRPLDVKWLCKRCHMKIHHGQASQKKDNSTLPQKVALRKNLLLEVQDPVVMETHGGFGEIFKYCYRSVKTGVVFEKNTQKTDVLAKQRPHWMVYETDFLLGLRSGCGRGLGVNFLDIDPYGDPFPALEAFFAGGYAVSPVLAVAVNDGLRQKTKMNGGWTVRSLKKIVEQFGNADLYRKYLEVCRAQIENISGPFGYKITKWAGYYCGHLDQMTHYAAVLCR